MKQPCSSGSINANGSAKLGGTSLFATGTSNGNVTFNGSTKTVTGTDQLQVIAQGSITYNGSSDTRGSFLSVGTFTFNGSSSLYGSIGAKGDITFNGKTTVIWASIRPFNQAPTDLGLNPASIAENVLATSVVGTLSTTDPNPGNTFTYSLVTGTGSTDNAAFSIVGNQLKINASPDFESKSSYGIRVKTTDQDGLSYEKALTVFITDVNEAPTNLILSSSITPENVAAGSVIGTLSTTDPDTNNTFTYSLVTGTGSTDNAAFSIAGNQLKINASPDFETKSSYSILVRTTDQGGLSYEKTFVIGITDVNEAPTSLLLSNNTTAENIAAGSIIGTLTSVDPDANNTFTYSLVSGTGATDNGAFSIVNNQLKINASPDFEAKSSYSVRIRTTDQGGLSYEKTLVINVTDINEAPTSLVLSNATTAENVAVGSVIGTLSTTDPDANNTFTYSLVSGTGSADNAAFTIVGNQLKINASPDFETKSSYSILVRTTDQGGLSYNKSFIIGITDVNEAPTSLVLSNNTTPENVASGSVIGTLSTIDPDANNTFTYSLVSGTGSTDNAAFSVVGNQLEVNASPDFEAKSSYSVRVRTTDQGGLSYEKTFVINVTDVNEAPTSLVLSNNITPENVAAGSVIGNLTTTDPDSNNTFTYGLVSGTGSTDNGAFSIVGNQLKINTSPNFEAQPNYSVRVRTTDQGGLSYEQAFVINVTDVNETPTALTLSNNVTPENVVAGSVIGTLSSTDPDANNSFTYSLVTGTGDVDNAAFLVVGNQLKINASPDFESKSSYSVRVRTTDQGGLSYDKSFVIGITDVNETPTNLVLSNNVTPENVAAGSVIGTLSSTDPDANNTFTYSLVSGTGATDNSAFLIVNNQLQINASPDFETKSSYSVRLRTTDQGGLSFEKTFMISVTDVNEAPTSLVLSNNITPENVVSGSVIGTLSTADPDANNTFTYSLVTGTGSTDNAAFSIVGNQLKINASPDFEAKSSYSILVRTTDQGGLSYDKSLVIGITDVNETPTSLVLSNNVTPENIAVGSVIGTLSTTDPDANNTFICSLVAGTGDIDNAAFTLTGNQLKINASPDFEAKSSYSVRVRTTDQGGLSYEKALTISVVDVNEAPTSLLLSNNTTPENVAAGSVIGTFTTTDPDATNTFSYSLVSGTGDIDNASFSVMGNQLKINTSPDFETKSSYSVRVRTTDQGGLSYDKAFTVAITNVNEAPTQILFTGSTVVENSAPGTVIGQLSTQDPDAGDSFTYQLLNDAGGRFQLVGTQIQVRNGALLDFEQATSHSITIQTTDAGGLSKTQQFALAVTNVNEAPTDLSLNPSSTPENVAPGSTIGSFSTTDPDANNTFSYSLVSGTGSTDNAAFSVVNNQLKINASPDFETKSSYSVRVRTTDQGGLSTEKALTVSILNVNEAPTSISLTNTSIPENSVTGTVIGQLSTTDPDIGDTYQYTLTDSAGDRLEIIGNTLRVKAGAVLDFETTPSLSIEVKSTDAGGLSTTQRFSIALTNVNEAPTLNPLTDRLVNEGSLVSFSAVATDPDQPSQPLTYSLMSSPVPGVNLDPSTGLFTWTPTEAQGPGSYSFAIKVSDGALSDIKTFNIQVAEVNSAPVLGAIADQQVQSGDTLTLQTSATDVDQPINALTYSLDAGAPIGAAIDPTTGLLSWTPNTVGDFQLTVRVIDNGTPQLFDTKTIRVQVTSSNQAPTALALSPATIAENSPDNSTIGTLSTTDPDVGNTFTYSLVSGSGSTDNGAFTIVGNQLKINASPDYEAKSSYSIRVKTTDQGGLSVEQGLAIAVTNLNEAPTDIALSATTIAENTPIGTVVGTLSATDPDQNDTQQYSLVSGTGATDNAAFKIVGNQLQLQTPPNFATHPSYSIRVKATDAGGLSTEKELSLTVLDTTAPLLQAGLAHDTAPNGQTNTDTLTSDPSIQGTVTDNGTIAQLKAWFDGQTPSQAQSIQPSLNGNGQFQLSRIQLETIYGRLLSDGQYTLNLQAIDAAGNASAISIHFTLDTAAPTTTGFNLAPGSDTAPTGDFKTKQSVVNVLGQSEPNAQVKLINTGVTLSVDGTGQFQFTNIPLTLGDNPLTIQITDGAGNTQTVTQTFTRVNGGDVVIDWNAIALEAIRTDRTAPPRAAYILAVMHTSIFDAVDAIDQKYDVYKIDATAAPNASPEAAAIAAGHRILVHYFPHQQAVLDLAYTQSLAKLPDSTSKNDGIALGESVADQMLALRANDGTEAVVAETPSTDIGKWRPTGPQYDGAALPQWPDVETFALVDGAQFRPDGSPALDSAQYAADYNLTQQLGAKNSTTRTADQTQIAKFWADGAGTYTPPGHWNQIAQDAAANSGNSLIDNARLFALLDVSLADSGIAAWDAKYQYDFWRPITAIQQGDLDGNPLTAGDPTWTPLIKTPPFAEYVSGHSTFSGAASIILTDAFGSNYSFTTTSYGLTGITRSFTSFDQAAEQAGMSRIYGGIHFNSANQDGLALGRNVGSYVASHYFQPVNRSTVLQANLANDTAPVGTTNRDKITSDPTITGKVTGTSVVLKAGLDQTTPTGYQNITAFLAPDGSFTLNAAALSQLNGSTLQDGIHTVHFQVFSAQGSVLESQDLAFVLDRGAPSASFEAPTVNAIYSPTAHLKGKIVDTLSQGGAVRYSIDGQAYQQFKADASGQFDQIISPTGLGVGNHQVAVEIYDAAGNMSPTAIAFTVSDQFSEGGTQTTGWGTQTADTLTLYEGNSFEVQKVTPVTVGVSAGTRTLEFDVNASWDLKDIDAVAQDRLLVYLVNPSNPSQTLLDGGEAGTALFSLSGTQAEYRPGLVRFDGRHVSIDVSSLPVGTTGNLVFQMLNLDGDTGSSVQVLNLTNTVDPIGTPSPIFSVVNPRSIAGSAVSLDSYLSNPEAKVLLSNVHLDPTTGRLLADLRVQNTGIAPISRNMAVLFPNLPSGVSLLNASGTHPAGSSYLNLKPALVDGDLKAGATLSA